MRAFLNRHSYIDKYEDKLNEITEIEIASVKFDIIWREHYEDIIQKVLDANAPLTSFTLRDSLKIDALPKTLPKNQITHIRITDCTQFIDIGIILNEFPQLESLIYKGKKVKLGKDLLSNKNLKTLSIEANKIDYIEGISVFENLENLTLSKLDIKAIPTLDSFSQLQNLNLNELKSVSELGNHFENLPLLKVHLDNIGQSDVPLNPPLSLFESKKIEELYLSKLNIKELPNQLGNLIHLKKLFLTGLNIPHLPDVFEKLSSLIDLRLDYCHHITQFPKSINQLSQLKTFGLMFLDKLERVDFENHQLKSLKEFSLYSLPNLTTINFNTQSCEALTYVGIYRSDALTSIKDDLFLGKNIENVVLNHLLNLKNIPDTLAHKPSIKKVQIEKIPSLEYMPRNILPENSHSTFEIENINHKKFNGIDKSLFNDIRWKIEMENRPIIFDWILHKEKITPTSKKIADTILKSMSLGHKKINNILITEIHGLNPDGKSIDAATIENGDKVFISGRLASGKELAKSKLEKLNLKLVSKLTDDVKFILLGNKPKFTDDLFNGKRIYFSQVDLETLKKELHPEMLQKKETPQNLVNNLNQLIYTKDEVNTNLAFEMVQQHGLPTKLEEGFLVLYHTMSKGKLRNQIKKFLKGKLSAPKDHILESKTYPFAPHKVRGHLTSEEATRLYYTEYKRTGKLRNEFFIHCDVSFPGRREVFEAILPTITKNPKRINIEAVLTTGELDELLSLPKFKGQLKEATIFYPYSGDEIKGLKLHQDSLKKLHIAFLPQSIKIPKCIYDVINLTDLKISSSGKISKIPEGISQLQSLKKLSIWWSASSLELPTDVIELKKLKTFNCHPQSSLEQFKSQMPWVF